MRSISIDVLRGIAILGILFINIPFHANMSLGYVPFSPNLFSDQLMTLLYSIFADGRFRTLFCLLFGAGLAIQYDACKRKSIKPDIFLKSRLNWLLFFGALHAVFIWGGDILMLYSVVGLVFIKGLSSSPDVLLNKARKFVIIGCTLILTIALLMIVFADPSENMVRGSEAYQDEMAQWQGNYLYQSMVHAGFAFFFLLLSPVSMFWQILGLMYLGAYLYRTDFFTQGFSAGALTKIIVVSIVTTLLCISPQLFLQDLRVETISLLSSISATFMALVYAHIVVKLCRAPGKLIQALANAGKVAFSLYILQSVVMAILLRGIWSDFSLNATLFDYFLLVLSFTLVQILLANVYLGYFKQGPLEALWRKLYTSSVDKKLNEL